MEACVVSNEEQCLRVISNSGSSKDPRTSTDCSVDLSMHDLKTCLFELLVPVDLKKSTVPALNLPLVKSNISNKVKEDDLVGLKPGRSALEECDINCVALMDLSESVNGLFNEENEQKNERKAQMDVDKTSDAFDYGCVKSVDHCYSPSMPLPAPLKLMSAMKGSREKLGIPPTKLSVTWASDVYDPIPTSVSHFRSSRNQHYRNKKYGKSKQRGGGGSKSSRGSKHKDKKHALKKSNCPTKSKALPNSGMLVGFTEPLVGESDIGASPDPSCGSSFLKKSVPNLHFSVAEAK